MPPPTAMPMMAGLLRGCEVTLSAVDVDDVGVEVLVIRDVPEPPILVVRVPFDAPVALAMGAVATAPTPTWLVCADVRNEKDMKGEEKPYNCQM